MSPFYRPSTFSGGFAADAPTPPSGSAELSGAGLAAHAETQLSNPTPAEISKAHTFFKAPPVDARMLAGPQLIPGAEQAALSVVPPVPGASEPISPIIQLIMRLPGHVGLLNSFFEALGHIFMPDMSMFGSLDPTLLAHQAHGALESLGQAAGGHLNLESILPSDSSLLHAPAGDLSFNSTSLPSGVDTVTGQISPSAGEHFAKSPFDCSGEFDLTKPHYESAGSAAQPADGGAGYLSGPQMSGSAPSNYLAGQHRMFSDKQAFGQPNLSAGSSSQTSGQSPSSLNVGASPFAQQVQGLSSPVNLAGRQTFGPSGAVSDHLGGRELLASGQSSGSFDSASYTPVTPGGGEAAGSAGEGLRATQLTLPGVKAPHSNVMDHIGHQTKGAPHPSHTGVDEIAHRSLSGDPQAHPAHSGNHASHFKHAATHREHGQMLKEADNPKAEATEKVASADTRLDQASATDAPSNYTIKPGDCLWNIARDHGLNWQDIYKLNTDVLGKNPDLIHPGVEIKLPGAGGDLAGAGEMIKHVVKSGDSLWKIAHDYLGNGKDWGQIYRLNHDVVGADPRLIFPGQELTLPGAGAASSQVASASQAQAAIANAQPPAQPAFAQSSTPSAGGEGVLDSATSVPAQTPAQMAGPPGRMPFNSESLAPSSLRPDLGQLLQGRR